MNIMIELGLFDRLIRKYQICQALFGSDDEGSDKDYIHIIRYDSHLDAVCPYFKGHPLQYKDSKGNDHIVMTINQLVTSLVSGDNFLSYKFIEKLSPNGDIWDLVDSNRAGIFNTYRKYKSLLGVVERDFMGHKKLSEIDNDFSQNKAKKKLKFAVSGYNDVAEVLGEPKISEQNISESLIKKLRKDLLDQAKEGKIPFITRSEKVFILLMNLQHFSVRYDYFETQTIIGLYEKTYSAGI